LGVPDNDDHRLGGPHAVAAVARIDGSPPAIAAIVRRSRLRFADFAPWIAIAAGYFLFPKDLNLGTQILVNVLFVLSLDLAVGYAGIVTLGHGAFYGIGAYCAGIIAVRWTGEPFVGVAAAVVLAGIAGLISGAIILRTRGLTLLMLTFGLLLMLEEAANRAAWLTGGTDGLNGVTISPLFGIWQWDFLGHTAYVYAAVWALIGFAVVRTLVFSPFGRSLRGIGENTARMEAIGAPVRWRLIAVYTISAAMAGLAGAVNTQVNQFVGVHVLSFEFCGAGLIMLILAGAGRLYGAFIGPPIYMIAAQAFSDRDPTYWTLWLGLLLIAVVMFGRGGVLGIASRLGGRLRLVGAFRK
jgi:branched-chain amino acid transport system permease protein